MKKNQTLTRTPPSCPDCHSIKMESHGLGTSEILLCKSCGVEHEMMEVIAKGYTPYLKPIFVEHPYQYSAAAPMRGVSTWESCPHCGNFTDVFADPICNICNIDRTELEIVSQDLAHLWKDGGKIREYMEKGRFPPKGVTGQFIREECGPHCMNADVCPQTFEELTRCRKRWMGEEVKEPKSELLVIGPSIKKYKTYSNTRPTAFFQCAEAGWFSEMIEYVTQDYNRKQSENTGNESGAKEVHKSAADYPQP